MTTSNPPSHVLAYALAQTLKEMLEKEFEQLKSQDVEGFDTRQEEKNELLVQLTDLVGVKSATEADALDQEWDEFKSIMRICRDLHRRNEIFVQRKIDAIRGAIQSLRIDDPTSSVEIYDRLGRVSRRQRGRGYADV